MCAEFHAFITKGTIHSLICWTMRVAAGPVGELVVLESFYAKLWPVWPVVRNDCFGDGKYVSATSIKRE